MSAMRPKAYLAGPDVFLPDPFAAAAEMKAACAEFGIEGVFPLDGEVAPSSDRRAWARAIQRANVRLIRGCDLVIANMTPFRGPNVDDGTAWEMGFAAALGKPVFGWSEDPRDYLAKVAAGLDLAATSAGPRDPDGNLVEDFGHSANLMMGCSIEGEATHGEFRAAVRAAAAHFGLRIGDDGPILRLPK